MVSILDQGVGLAEESTYGTAVTTGIRQYEARGDGWERTQQYHDSGGFHSGSPAMQGARRRVTQRGGSGTLESAVLTQGEGVRLEHLLGSATNPTAGTGDDSDAYTQVFKANSTGPAGSYTAFVRRTITHSTPTRWFQYTGCVPTGFSLNVDDGSELVLSINYDVRAETLLTSSPGSGFTDVNGIPFIWSDCVVQLGGSNVTGVKSFSLDVDLMMDTERYFLDGGDLKSMPVRNGVPTFSGTLSCEMDDPDKYDDFIKGVKQSLSLKATAPGSIGAAGVGPSFEIELPEIQYEGSTPQMSRDGLTMIELPFVALSDTSEEVCNITYVSADSTR